MDLGGGVEVNKVETGDRGIQFSIIFFYISKHLISVTLIVKSIYLNPQLMWYDNLITIICLLGLFPQLNWSKAECWFYSLDEDNYILHFFVADWICDWLWGDSWFYYSEQDNSYLHFFVVDWICDWLSRRGGFFRKKNQIDRWRN